MIRGIVMNFYITSGTYDFLYKIKAKYPNEMLLMQNNENAVLLHETEKKSIFSMPQSFKVIESFGSFENAEFAAASYIPLTEEETPLFEYRFKNSHTRLQSQSGFIALRILQPFKKNTHVILTLWNNEIAFKNWQTSPAYHQFFDNSETNSNQLHLFSGSSYSKTYFIIKEKE